MIKWKNNKTIKRKKKNKPFGKVKGIKLNN